MPKNQSRSRNRKINFKTRIQVRRGDVVVEEADPAAQHAAAAAIHDNHVETGVDKEEEHELHLQNVISASAASYAGRTGPTRVASTSKLPMPHIPTPDATGVALHWEPLYPKVYADPNGLIRFSDTVEDCIGVPYTMDEDDEDWLVQFNSSSDSRKRICDQSPTNDSSRSNRSLRKSEKNKDAGGNDGDLSENDFEVIMDHFELVAEERVPMLHLDLSKIPPFSDFEGTFVNNDRLGPIKHYAAAIYPHWVARRTARGGKCIIPQLDYDETREDNPYVCFRRREPKNVRKTRRTDAQNVERLIRLSTDLAAARELMIKVLERETCKRDGLRLEHEVFEGRAQLRTLKRRLNEPEGDDNLLFGKTHKRRKLEDSSTAGREALKIPLRLSRPGPNHTVPATPAIAEPIQPYRDRTAQISAQIDRDMAKKRENDRDYEDWTDGAYLPIPLATQARLWRAPDNFTLTTIDGQSKGEVWTFGQTYPHALGGVRPSFRRRTGRGGRVFLDRTTPRSQNPFPDSEEAADLIDRWKFDSDAADLPGAGVQPIIDDMACANQSARISLFKPGDLQTLAPSTLFLEEAQKWIAREPEKRPVTKIHGSLQYRQMPPQNLQSVAFAQLQANQPQPPTASQQAAVMSQMQANAAQIGQMTQMNLKRNVGPAQVPLNGAAIPGGSPVPQLRRMPSGQLVNGANGQAPNPNALAQWQAMNNNNLGLPAKAMDPAAYQQLSNQLSQQLQAAGPNAMQHFARPIPPLLNGLSMNGFPLMPQLLPNGNAQLPMAISSPQTSEQLLNAPAPSPGLLSRRSPAAPSLKLGLSQPPPLPAQPV